MSIVERELAHSGEAGCAAPDEVSERERRARVLEAAALEIEVRGWCRGARERDGALCMVGAISAAAFSDPLKRGGYSHADETWGRPPGEMLLDIWNDVKARSADEVTFPSSLACRRDPGRPVMTHAALEAELSRVTRQRDYMAAHVEELEAKVARLESRARWLGMALSYKSAQVDVADEGMFSMLVESEQPEVYL